MTPEEWIAHELDRAPALIAGKVADRVSALMFPASPDIRRVAA